MIENPNIADRNNSTTTATAGQRDWSWNHCLLFVMCKDLTLKTLGESRAVMRWHFIHKRLNTLGLRSTYITEGRQEEDWPDAFAMCLWKPENLLRQYQSASPVKPRHAGLVVPPLSLPQQLSLWTSLQGLSSSVQSVLQRLVNES